MSTPDRSGASRLPYKGHRFGRLIVTTCRQPAGAPFVDDGFTRDADGREYASKTILLTPWRKNEYGEHVRQRALTVGWRPTGRPKVAEPTSGAYRTPFKKTSYPVWLGYALLAFFTVAGVVSLTLALTGVLS